MSNFKKVLLINSAPERHWVGDAFYVHGMFGYNGEGVLQRSPFLLLDYAAPINFEPNAGHKRGVGAHPHRGFETVTIVYDGQVQHKDSSGAGGVIKKGDVQWMTAGAGIIHEEFHSEEFSKTGGIMEMVQLWVNLPAKDKKTPANYQGIEDSQIPQIELDNKAGFIRVIAGEYGNNGKISKAPTKTFTKINILDLRLNAGHKINLKQPDGFNTLILILDGVAQINDDEIIRKAQIATLSNSGEDISLEANSDSKILILAGEPIDEPVVGYGPFVMNSREEISQAITDYQSGRFGKI